MCWGVLVEGNGCTNEEVIEWIDGGLNRQRVGKKFASYMEAERQASDRSSESGVGECDADKLTIVRRGSAVCGRGQNARRYNGDVSGCNARSRILSPATDVCCVNHHPSHFETTSTRILSNTYHRPSSQPLIHRPRPHKRRN